MVAPIPHRNKLIAVIDGTNLKGALTTLNLTTWINYRQLAIEIAKRVPKDQGIEPWTLERVVYITAAPIQSHNRERYSRWREFQSMIERTERVSLRLGRLEGGPGRVYEKGVDILVALELLRGAYKNEYDSAIIVAGDGDYADVAREARDAGKVIINSFFELQKSFELSQASNCFVDLNRVGWERLALRSDNRNERRRRNVR